MNFKNVGKFWSPDEELQLIAMVEDHEDIYTICNKLQRNPGGIIARVSKLKHKIDPIAYGAYMARYEFFSDLVESQSVVEIVPDEQFLEVKCKGERMKNNQTWTMVSLLQEDITTVSVVFRNRSNGVDFTKPYTYKTRDKSIKLEDWVIVNPGAVEGFFSIGQVVAIHEEPNIEPDSGMRYHWIVGKVDTTAYDELVAKDERAYQLLVDAEKHVARKKVMDMYADVLQLKDAKELRKLLK